MWTLGVNVTRSGLRSASLDGRGRAAWAPRAVRRRRVQSSLKGGYQAGSGGRGGAPGWGREGGRPVGPQNLEQDRTLVQGSACVLSRALPGRAQGRRTRARVHVGKSAPHCSARPLSHVGAGHHATGPVGTETCQGGGSISRFTTQGIPGRQAPGSPSVPSVPACPLCACGLCPWSPVDPAPWRAGAPGTVRRSRRGAIA